MISAITNHLWQSTLFAGAAGLLVLVLRNNHAQVRYWIWLIASLKFLVPFSAIVGLGSYLAPATTAPAASAGFSDVVTEIGQPFIAPSVSFAAVHPSRNPVPEILLAFWLCGFLVVAFRSCARWRRVRATVRAARSLGSDAGVPVLSSPALLEPGIFGIFRPVLVMPEGIADHLSREQLQAILAHELCHVRRRDNLFAALHMLVEAIFWFHPLVWWIGARLVEERERACDEEVLRLGNEPEIYAESILKTCRFYLESPLACMSGVTGADLKKRVVRIMTQSVGQRIGFAGKALLAGVGTLAIAGPLAFGFINTPQTLAQSTAAESSGAKPKFEVASIKRDKSGDRTMWIRGDHGRFWAHRITIEGLIVNAYDLYRFQISGGPAWIHSARYDIEAKPPDDPAIDPRRLKKRRNLMLQALLADRFQFRFHTITKQMSVYALIIAKGGPKLTRAPEEKGNLRMGRGQLTAQGLSIHWLAKNLSGVTGRVVLDKTGLSGYYNLTLKWAPKRAQLSPFGQSSKGMLPASVSNGPSIFTAIQEQLGLKLKAEKGPVQVLVIDHVERPSAN